MLSKNYFAAKHLNHAPPEVLTRIGLFEEKTSHSPSM